MALFKGGRTAFVQRNRVPPRARATPVDSFCALSLFSMPDVSACRILETGFQADL